MLSFLKSSISFLSAVLISIADTDDEADLSAFFGCGGFSNSGGSLGGDTFSRSSVSELSAGPEEGALDCSPRPNDRDNVGE